MTATSIARSLVRIVPMLLMLGPFVVTASTAQQSRTVTELSHLVRDIDQAISTLDVPRFMKHFVRDSSLTYVFNGRQILGWKEVERVHQDSWPRMRSAEFESGPVRVGVLGPDAAVTTAVAVGAFTGADGTTLRNQYAITLAWRRTEAGWRVVQAHESTAPLAEGR